MNKIIYNKKIDYLLSKYIFHNSELICDEEQYRNVYYCKLKPINKQQKILVKTKNIIDYYKNKNIPINIPKVYIFLANNQQFKKSSIFKIKKLLKIIENSKYNKGINAYTYIVKEKPFSILNYEMAILIFNLIRISCNKIPIVFYPRETQSLNKAIMENKNKKIIEQKFISIIQNTYQINVQHRFLDLDFVINKLLDLKLSLYKKFSVIEVEIYGSYARGEETKYSDLDLIIVTINKCNRLEIFEYLKKNIGINIDGKVFEKRIDNSKLTIDMLRHKIKVY